MKLRFFFITVLYLFMGFGGGTGSSSASSDTVTVEIAPSTYQVTIGDSLSIFCTVTFPDGVRCEEPQLSGDRNSPDVTKQWQTQETNNTGGFREQYGYLTYVFTPDTLAIGPFIVDYVSADGTNGSALSNKLTLVVGGFIENPEATPKANRLPFGIPSGGIPLWAVVCLLLLAAAILGIILYFVRRKKPVPLAVPAKPIDEIGEFERIRSMKLYESGRIRELYILMSSAMRGFIHRNMGFEALYKTSEEILSNISRQSHDTVIAQEIREIFDESDMVKFAKYSPPEDRTSTVIDRALVPVKKVLDTIAREKARLAEELESKESQEVSAPTPVTGDGGN